MERFVASCYAKDAEITARVAQVVVCPDATGEHLLYETEDGERRRLYDWCSFESIHETREAAELWIAERLEKFAAVMTAKAEEHRHAAAERVAKAQVMVTT